MTVSRSQTLGIFHGARRWTSDRGPSPRVHLETTKLHARDTSRSRRLDFLANLLGLAGARHTATALHLPSAGSLLILSIYYLDPGAVTKPTS